MLPLRPHKEAIVRGNRTVIYVALAAGAVLLILGAPLRTALPVGLLLLACPLMMVVMMRGMSGANGENHSGHGREHGPSRREEMKGGR